MEVVNMFLFYFFKRTIPRAIIGPTHRTLTSGRPEAITAPTRQLNCATNLGEELNPTQSQTMPVNSKDNKNTAKKKYWVRMKEMQEGFLYQTEGGS